MSTLPEDLQKIVDAVDASDRAAAEIAGRVTEEEFQWQPGEGGRWSIAQCLDHLATMNVVYTAALREGIALARDKGWTRKGPATPGFFGRRFVAFLEPPARVRTRTPVKGEPRLRRTRAEIMTAFRDAHDGFRRAIADCATLDVNRATFQNPFVSWVRVRVATGLQVIPAHDRRHLWQAEQVEKEIRARKTEIV